MNIRNAPVMTLTHQANIKDLTATKPAVASPHVVCVLAKKLQLTAN